jgi:hypothetical protein
MTNPGRRFGAVLKVLTKLNQRAEEPTIRRIRIGFVRAVKRLADDDGPVVRTR